MKFLMLLILGFASSLAQASQPYACTLKRPFVFGASITAGYNGLHDGAGARAAATMGYSYFGSNTDPVTRVAKRVNKDVQVTNISEMINVMKFGAFGYLQLQDAVQNEELLAKLRASTIIASMDAFYWPMAFGNCRYNLANLDWIMSLARSLNKPLLLATVPIEDPEKVSRIVRMGWTAPEPSCTARFNKYLLETCRAENNCFVADIAETVVRLNSTGIEFKGKLNQVWDFRFDGVHLSLDGNEWIQKLIHEALLQGNHRCEQ